MKHTIYKLIGWSVLIILLCWRNPVLGQTGGIAGIVFDRDTTVEYTAIVLSRASDSSQVSGMTAIDGHFAFANIEEGAYLLHFSCLGYTPQTLAINVKDRIVDLGKVFLEKDAKMLEAVKIQGKRRIFKQENGLLTVNVNNTILSEAGSLVDVLKRSPGLMVDNNQQISIPGKGTPIIYIDNREIQSQEELTALKSSDIDKIEIIRNASARYSAESNAVIRIKTKRAIMDKLALSVSDQFQIGRKIGNTAGFQLDHKSGKWSNLLSYTFQNRHTAPSVHSNSIRYLTEDTLSNTGNFNLNYYKESHQLFSGNEYAINRKHSVGLQFSGIWNKDILSTQSSLLVRQTALPEKRWENLSRKNSHAALYNANLNYLYRPDSLKTLSIIAGYAYQGNRSQQNISEQNLSDSSLLHSKVATRSDYGIYSVQADYAFNLFRFADMSVGAKYSQTGNHGKNEKRDFETDALQYTMSSHILDKIAAGYFDITKTMGNFSVQAGLRYEYTFSQSRVNEQTITSSYHSLFPNFTANYTKGKYSVGLAYSRRISRPPFVAINPEIAYNDTYSYSMGNPRLKPAFMNSVELYATIGNFHLLAAYTHRKDAFRQVARMDASDPDVMAWTFINIKSMHVASIGGIYSNTWKWYSGHYEAYLVKRFSRVPYLSGELRREQPYVLVKVSNVFQIVKNLSLNCDFLYESAWDEFANHFEPTYDLSVGLVWKLLNGNLILSLMADNILGLANFNCFNSMYENFYLQNREDSGNRYIRIGVRYNFNNIKSGIHRKEATGKELERIF